MTFLNAGRRIYNVADVTFFSANPTCDPQYTLSCYPPPPRQALCFGTELSEFAQGEREGHCCMQTRWGFFKKKILWKCQGSTALWVQEGAFQTRVAGDRRPTAGCRGLPKWTALYIPNGCSKFGAGRGGGEEETPVSTWSFKNDPTQCFCIAGSCPNVGTYCIWTRLTSPAL